jgi:hypothetical protein
VCVCVAVAVALGGGCPLLPSQRLQIEMKKRGSS